VHDSRACVSVIFNSDFHNVGVSLLVVIRGGFDAGGVPFRPLFASFRNGPAFGQG